MSTIGNQNTTKVFVQSYLELLRATGKPYELIPNSTLNQKLGINHTAIWPPAGSTIQTTQFPNIGYMCIGKGGHQYHISAGNPQGTIKQRLHDSIHCSMYDQIPFVARPISEDLTEIERQKYRLREVRTIGGDDYAVYWAKVVDMAAIAPTMKVVRIENGEQVETWDYVPGDHEDEQLNPEIIMIDNVNANVVNGLHLEVKSSITVELNAADIAEIVNALATLWPGTTVEDATISEVAVVWGFDMNRTVPGVGVITELAAAQIINHIGTHIALQYHNNLVKLSYGLADGLPVLTELTSS